MKTLVCSLFMVVLTFFSQAAWTADRVVVIPLHSSSMGVPKTGQTTCYDASGHLIACSGTGQDGELQRGVAWPVPRFSDHGDGTVTDRLTGLIWLKNANCMYTDIPWFDADDTNFPEESPDSDVVRDGHVRRSTAMAFIAGLNAGQVSLPTVGKTIPLTCNDTSNDGKHQSDWRLPNRFELESLLDLGNMSPALPTGHPFTNVSTGRYWSSSFHSYYADLGVGWSVYLGAGDVRAQSWELQAASVWPVRGGVNRNSPPLWLPRPD